MSGNSQNNSSMDKDEDGSFMNQSLSEDNLSASLTVSLETQIQLDKMKKQINSLKMKIGETEEENGQLRAEVDRLNLENKDLQEDLELEQKKKVKSEISSPGKYEEVLDKLQQVERELETKTFEYDSATKNIQVLESKINEMRGNFTDQKETLVEELEEFKSKCRRLEQVEATNNLYKKKLEELSELKNNYRELEDQNENLISQIEGKVNIFNRDFLDNETEIKMCKNYKEMYSTLQAELGQERENTMKLTVDNNDLRMQLGDITNDKKRLEKDLEYKENRIKKMLIEHQYRSSEYESANSYDLKANAEGSDLDTLDKEIGGELHNISIEKNEDYKKLKQENELLKQQIRDQENSLLQKLENDIQKKENSLKLTQEDTQRLSQRCSIFEKQNQELKTEIDKLKNEHFGYLELQNEYKLMKGEKKANKEKIKKLQEKVKELGEANAELESLKKTHEDLKQEKEKLKSEVEEIRALSDKHKEENFKSREQILLLENEVSN